MLSQLFIISIWLKTTEIFLWTKAFCLISNCTFTNATKFLNEFQADKNTLIDNTEYTFLVPHKLLMKNQKIINPM